MKLTKDLYEELDALRQANDALRGPSFIMRNHWHESGYRLLVRRGLVEWGDPPPGFDKRRFAGTRIIAVAISAFGIVASLPSPARHGDVLRKLWDFNGTVLGPETQGFITNTGRFVGRRDAAAIAVAAGQIDAPQWPPDLYSEDLW